MPIIPVTIGGSNNVTFTLKGSTRPIPLWTGSDIIFLDEDLVYTWGAVSNNILSSTGAATTDVDSVLGIWYMYAAIQHDAADGSEAVILRPSQTAPEYSKQGPFGYLTHPGTAKAYEYNYVGFMECTTAATPAFRTAVKVGYWYKFAPISVTLITDAWTAPTSLTLRIPQLARFGLEVRGTLETGANGQVFIGSYSASTIWDAELDISEATASNAAEQVLQAQVQLVPNDSTSPLYAIAAPAGDFHLLAIKDAV